MNTEKSNLWKFIGKMGLMFLLLFWLAVFIGLLTIRPNRSNLYNQKKAITSSTSPKLVFIGGSNCLFGVDSELLENELEIPVVDYCVQAGLPLDFSFKQIEPYLKDGDTILLILEYGYYAGVNNPEAVTSMMDSYPQGIMDLMPSVWRQTPDLLQRLASRRITRLLDHGTTNKSVFDHSYNRWGDGTYLLEYNGEIEIDEENGSIPVLDSVDSRVINLIGSFQSRMNQRGVKVYLTYPSMWNRQYNPQADKAEQLDSYLKSKFPGLVISFPADYVYRKVYISNTSYHLNREGRILRTRQIISDLLLAGWE